MASVANKQTAINYERFKELYETWLNDTSLPYEARCERWKSLEHKYPKFYAKYMLTTGYGSLSEGSTVWLNIRKRSRTGYSKSISVYSFVNDKDYGIRQASLTYHVAHLMGYTVHDVDGWQTLRTDDYPQEFVAHLSQALFGVDKSNALRCEVL